MPANPSANVMRIESLKFLSPSPCTERIYQVLSTYGKLPRVSSSFVGFIYFTVSESREFAARESSIELCEPMVKEVFYLLPGICVIHMREYL